MCYWSMKNTFFFLALYMFFQGKVIILFKMQAITLSLCLFFFFFL